MSYTIQQISLVIKGTALLAEPESLIEHLLVDSRRLVFPSSSLFFALSTQRRDGSFFIEELYTKGVRSFIVKEGFDVSLYIGANFIFVDDPLRSLQQLAAYHRKQFNVPVIGITGSNGKTIVKEWLYQLLSEDFKIIRSPKSYNSQIGVPLSVWQINAEHDLAIIEAGISQPGEMEYLEEIIKPSIGVLTNIGEAHREGFVSVEEKAFEKVKFFRDCKRIVYCKNVLIANLFKAENEENSPLHNQQEFCWSRTSPADLIVLEERITANSTTLKVLTNLSNEELVIEIPFIDRISVDNAVACLSVILAMGLTIDNISERFKKLSSIEMRMQLKKAVNNCTIINDSYSNDLSSLVLALDYLIAQKGVKKTTAVLSDIAESGLDSSAQYTSVITHLKDRKVDRAILIGPLFYKHFKNHIAVHHNIDEHIKLEFYTSTDAFLEQSKSIHFRDELILLKGARSFEFENISRWLEEKTHQTVMEVSLNAMIHNLKEHQQKLKPHTKVMAMVKAFSYGSGSAEVANILQFHKVDYLAVAYADEGVELRKAGINMPIMVMNSEPSTFSSLIEYNLEPEIYSFHILETLIFYLQQQAIMQFPVHLKIDTGMHRLGFEPDEINKLLLAFKHNDTLVIKSVFSHLVASENASLDDFTNKQAKLFEEACEKIQQTVSYTFIKHLSNSAAIFRHPHLQYDMVRLGIGLYGIATADNLNLQNVATLKSTIAQITFVKAGDSVGYSRKGILLKDSMIATVRIGYADGYSRKFGNGAGKMCINGRLAPVVGNICMDMTMIDVTLVENVHEGDEVEIFGANLPVQQVAKWADTIPYEILTGISQRIKRVYYEE